MKRAILLALVLLVCGGSASAQEATGVRFELALESDELGKTLGIVDPGDGSGRLFLTQQSGQIRVMANGVLLPVPFLDIADRISCCSNERGLVGLAFHPKYKKNGYFYVVYVNQKSRTIVSRFSVSTNRNVADPSSEEEIIRWRQPDLPHNGGAILFGPDGMLYLGSGDGGERDNAQDLGNLLGGILRINVDRAFPYAIPKDNPFVGVPGAREELWVYGLRNPWRISFDRETGDLFIGDVGASRWEEIDHLPGGSPAGTNFGWPIKEGPLCLRDAECDNEDLAAPIVSYAHDEDEPCNSVTGGYYYRGPNVPTLPGFYIFGDFCRGEIWGARQNLAGNWVAHPLIDTNRNISSFGEDTEGNLYGVSYDGAVYRVVGQDLFASDFETGNTLDWSQRRGEIKVGLGLRRSDAALEAQASAGPTFVRSKHPTAEKTFRVGFDLNVNGVNLAETSTEIFRLAGSSSRGHVRLFLEQENNRYWVNLHVRNDSGKFFSVGRTRVPRSRSARIEFDWMAASTAGADDGQVLLFKNGKVRIVAADLDNDRRKVTAATLGFPAGANGSGSVFFDNYVSTP